MSDETTNDEATSEPSEPSEREEPTAIVHFEQYKGGGVVFEATAPGLEITFAADGALLRRTMDSLESPAIRSLFQSLLGVGFAPCSELHGEVGQAMVENRPVVVFLPDEVHDGLPPGLQEHRIAHEILTGEAREEADDSQACRNAQSAINIALEQQGRPFSARVFPGTAWTQTFPPFSLLRELRDEQVDFDGDPEHLTRFVQGANLNAYGRPPSKP